MKTRIRKKEYKNGSIEYICEYESLKAESITCILLGFIFLFYFYIGGYLFTIKTLSYDELSINPIAFSLFIISLFLLIFGLYQYAERWDKISWIDSECVFYDLEEAKKSIDGHIFRHKQNKEKLEGQKTKKTTIIKYP
mgnify:FL=1